jgi:predicted dithiol-disulfide oxidoreductase (DUF899 family)
MSCAHISDPFLVRGQILLVSKSSTSSGAVNPWSKLNVFHRDGDTIRHSWGSELFYAPADPGQEPRHVGTLEPLWNLFDFTREGRPATWHEQFSY